MFKSKRKAKPIRGDRKIERQRPEDPAQAKPVPHSDGVHEWQPINVGGQILYILK